MTWLVVHFDAKNTVEAVPNTWYIQKESKCYWPPESTRKSIKIDYIQRRHSPEVDWVLYDAAILGTYDNYKVAQKKANKAKNTNDLFSNNELLRRKDKCKKKHKIHRKDLDSEKDWSSDISDILDNTIYPNIPANHTQLRNNVNVKNVEGNINNNRQLQATSTFDTTSTNSKTATFLEPAAPAMTVAQNTDFEKRVLRELHILTLKLDDISEVLNVLLKRKADEVHNPEHSEVPHIIQSFPVNKNSLMELENWLSSEQNKTILSENLNRIGGCNIKDIVRRIMYYVFTNEVGMSYSWEGAKGKKIFKNLAVTSSILCAVRLNKNAKNSTDAEIIVFIKAWLVRSKDRFNNYQKKINIIENHLVAQSQPRNDAGNNAKNDTENDERNDEWNNARNKA